MKEYTPFEGKLLKKAREQGWDAKQYLIPGKVTLETVLEKLKEKGVPAELLQKAIEVGMEDGSLVTAYKSDVFETYILPLPELQDFRRNIQPFLTPEQNLRMITVLASVLYAKLGSEAKRELTERMILRKSLNLGYIRLPRASHRQGCDFIVKYPALFKHEAEVLESMVERFVDEELSRTPIEETAEKIQALKKEVEKIYGSVK